MARTPYDSQHRVLRGARRDRPPARHWVAAGQGLPDVCAAHGNPVVIRKQTRIESTPPGWVWVLLPFGLLIFFIVRAVLRKAIIAPNWGLPDCINPS